MTEEARDLYSALGARPVINALGPRTFLGGSIPHPDVTAAMELAKPATASALVSPMDTLPALDCMSASGHTTAAPFACCAGWRKAMAALRFAPL